MTEDPQNVPEIVELPVVLSAPIYNADGFGVGFRLSHPPGVDCVFPESTKQCSCGRLDVGVVSSDESSTEPSLTLF